VPANVHHGETVDAEPVLLAVVAAETVFRNAVAVVAAALLPGAVLRLPDVGTITLPSDLLLPRLSRAPFLCGPVVLLLLTLMILLSSRLLLLSRGVVVLLTLLLLLILLAPGLLLVLFCGIVLLLTLLALLILLPVSLLLR